MDPALRVLFHRFQTIFDRIRLTFSFAAELNQQIITNAIKYSCFHKPRRLSSWTYKINKEAESRIRQESTPNAKRRSNWTRKHTRTRGKRETGLLVETKHMVTSFRRQRRESLRTRLSTWPMKITSFFLNNFAPEEFFGGPNPCRWTLQNSRMRPHYEGVLLCRTQLKQLDFFSLSISMQDIWLGLSPRQLSRDRNLELII